MTVKTRRQIKWLNRSCRWTKRHLGWIAISVLLAAQVADVQAASHPVKASSSKQDIVLATVGGKAIHTSDFMRYLQGTCSNAEIEALKTNREARVAALNDYLDLTALTAKAKKEGIDRTPLYRKACELMEMKILDSMVTERDRSRFTKAATVSDRELKAYYDSHPDQFQVQGGRSPFTEVKGLIEERVTGDKLAKAHKAYLDPIRAQMHLKETALAAQSDFHLDWDTPANDGNVLATLNGSPIHESDFKWFVKDAYRAEQRYQALSRPGSRRSMLTSYLNMRVLEAKARKDGLDKDAGFRASRDASQAKLLAEFLQEQDHSAPWMLPGSTEEAKAAAYQTYINQLRREVGFKVAILPHAAR